MNYDDRKRILFSFLTEKPDGVLLRYKRPEHLSDDAARAEVTDLVEDLNSHIPNCEIDKFKAILGRFKANLRQVVASRYWPTIPQCIKAMRAAVQDSPSDGIIDEETILAKLAAEFQSNGRCIRFLASDDLTRKLYVQHGYNLWDMRLAGFPMDKNLELEMQEQPRGGKYLAHHYRVLARIWNCSIGEAKARDMQNETDTPKEKE